MIKLEIPRKDEPHLALLDKLTALALQHQIRVNRRLRKAVLTDGSKRVEGVADITQYLTETEEELHQWWYCAC
ncbi:MAG: hypothetical protein AAGJ82_08520 [Bacteroidota bacterium]